jgi:hypothetical protein
MDRIERLLEMGYLPSQLPPAFVSAGLAKNYPVLLSIWDLITSSKGQKLPGSPAAKAETFSVARLGHQRRATSICNPIAQSFLCLAVVDNWPGVMRHFRRSKLSASRPRFRRDSSRGASLPAMQVLNTRRLQLGAGFRYVLRTDISRFFPTVYTHSIPWALHGKATAKRNRKITEKYYGNLLDMAIRQSQDGQTIGVPIGPDTSHIVAECIATAIDVELTRRLRSDPVGIRYVDDYYLFFETQGAAESALAHLNRSLSDFELQINFEKTKICRVEDLQEDKWTHSLRNFNFASHGQRQLSDIDHYFDLARDLAKSHSDESVMVYALRKSSSLIVRKENWSTYEAHLCLIAAAHPVTLQTIARIIATYGGLGYPINRLRLSRLANSLIGEHAPLEHHSEVAWCLWMCKELQLEVSAWNVDAVAEMHSNVTSLLLLDHGAANRLPKLPANTKWKQFEREEALWDDQWLLSYEAGLRGWGGMTDKHISADIFFRELKEYGVHFYEPNRRSTPMFAPKSGALAQRHLETIAELLEVEDLEDVFEHADDVDEYSGLAPIDPESEDDEPF